MNLLIEVMQPTKKYDYLSFKVPIFKLINTKDDEIVVRFYQYTKALTTILLALISFGPKDKHS